MTFESICPCDCRPDQELDMEKIEGFGDDIGLLPRMLCLSQTDHQPARRANKRSTISAVDDVRSWLPKLLLAERLAVSKQLEQGHEVIMTRIETWIEMVAAKPAELSPACLTSQYKDLSSVKSHLTAANADSSPPLNIKSTQAACTTLQHKDLTSVKAGVVSSTTDSVPPLDIRSKQVLPPQSGMVSAKTADLSLVCTTVQYKDLQGVEAQLVPATTDSLPPLLPVDIQDENGEDGESSSGSYSAYTGSVDSKSSQRRVLKIFMDMPSEISNAVGTDLDDAQMRRLCSPDSSNQHQEKLVRVFTQNKAEVQEPVSSIVTLREMASSLSLNREERELMKQKGLAWLVQSTVFEFTMAMIIALNAMVVAAKVQYDGAHRGFNLGVSQAYATGGNKVSDIFTVLEFILGSAFVLELLLKMFALRKQFCSTVWNMFDFLFVGIWVLETLEFINIGLDPAILRIIRLARLLKMIRLIRVIRVFTSFRLLVGSLKASVSTLFWSSSVLLLVQVISALTMCQLLAQYLEDETQNAAERIEVWKYFGTFARALLTMFEITLGNWIPPVRILLENVSGWYAIICVIYKLSVGFAVVNVISAVFVQQTIKVASQDEEVMIMQKKRDARRFQGELRRLFQDLDLQQDGVITFDEFQMALSNDRVRHLLAALEINVLDAYDVFELLNNGHNEVSWDEFLIGMLRLRGPAQSMDLMRLLFDHKREAQLQQDIMDEHRKILKHVEALQEDLYCLLRSAGRQRIPKAK